MATWYVNSITGNNSNNGSSWALAKATLAGVNAAASNGDTIYCHGRFTESVPVSKELTWVAFGYACIDGQSSRGVGVQPDINLYMSGFTFTNHITASVYMQNPQAGSFVFVNCRFEKAQYGARIVSGYYRTYQFISCEFVDNSIAGVSGAMTGSGTYHYNCIFSGNPISIDRSLGADTPVIYCQNSVFLDPIMLKVIGSSNGYYNSISDQNIFNFDGGSKCIYGGVDKITLADWKTAVGTPRDANSISRNATNDIGDAANSLLRPNPSSYLLTAGIGGRPTGLLLPAVTISNNKNATLWTGGVFSNTEIDGSGFLVLSAGQTSGYWRSNIIDFGASINAKSIEVSLTGEDATNYLDYDTGDSPGYYNLRVRGSNASFAKGDASPSWVTVPRNAEIGAYMSNALRYWQVELTLRGT